MKRLLSQITSAGLGLWLATLFVPGVRVLVLPDSNFFGIPLTAQWQFLIFLGIIIGLLNFFVKPILNTITFPLRIITLGLSSFIINMALLWIVDYIFEELRAPFLFPLLWTTFIIWVLNLILGKTLLKQEG